MLSRVQADNNALLEILRKLQATSTEEAHDFLEFIRSDSHLLDILSMTDWFRNRLPEQDQFDWSEDSGLSSYRRVRKHSLSVPGGPSASESRSSEDLRIDTDSEDTPHHSDFEPVRSFGGSITIDTVRKAVDSYSRSTGMLFYVFTKEQIDDVLDETLDYFEDQENTNFMDVVKTQPSVELNARLAEICGRKRLLYAYYMFSFLTYIFSQGWPLLAHSIFDILLIRGGTLPQNWLSTSMLSRSIY
jgi:hypothetical protein